jgi:excisionase family DNA binding protein
VRNSPVVTVDPNGLPAEVLARLDVAVDEARASGKLDLSALPDDVRAQLFFALGAVARGQQVAAVASGKPLTTTEAADLLGMSRTHLTRLCKEGRVPSFVVGNSLRVDSETVMTILRERGRIRTEARAAAATAEGRRRERAARAAGIA